MVKISRDFAGELEAGDIDAAAKAAGATPATGTAGLFMVARRAIKVLPGFNVRAETSEYKAHIEDLKLSLMAEGWYKHKPLAAYVVHEASKDVIYCVEGHSRLAAYDEAAAAGKRIGPIPVVFEGKARSVEDLTAQLANANKSRAYGPLELSVIVHRLSDYGWTTDRIAQKIGKTDRYVRDLLVLVDAPAAIKTMVAKGQVSATEAIKTIRAEGDDAADVLKDAFEAAEAGGRKKATAKHTDGQRRSKPPRAAPQRREPEVTSAAETVASDKDFLSAAINYALDVAPDTRDWLQRWRDGDGETLGELESFMGQPLGSMADRDLRIPMPLPEGDGEVFENVEAAGRTPQPDDEELLGESTVPAFAAEPPARRSASRKPAARKAAAKPAAKPAAKAAAKPAAKPAKAAAKPAKGGKAATRAAKPARTARVADAPAPVEAAAETAALPAFDTGISAEDTGGL